MKKILIISILCIATSTFAYDEVAMRAACPIQRIETWKDKENRAQCEATFRYYESQQGRQSQQNNNDNSHLESQMQQMQMDMDRQQSQQQIRDSQQRLNDIYRPR